MTLDAAQKKSEFLQIYAENIHREGAGALLAYLQSPDCDFFTAPASTQYHYACEGGLCAHSLNVYHCLTAYLARERCRTLYGMEYSAESAAIAALLHDLCKTNFYKVDHRNVKNERGVWEKVPYYRIDDRLPFGHGEKSVFLIQQFMRLTDHEAMAIRWHMGFSGPEEKRTIGRALEQYPLAFALHVADMEASYFIEGNP